MRRVWRFCDHPRRQLVNLPRTYFEVEDERPRESEGQVDSTPIFVSKGITIPGELNQSILKFLIRKDLLRVAKVSKTVERVVRKCKVLLFDAVHERINEFVGQNGRHDFVGQNGRQVNSHGFKKKNCVRVSVNDDQINAYCVGVTSKYVYYVHSENILDRHLDIKRVKSKYGVAHVRPYIGNVVEVMQNWRVKSHFRDSAS